MVFAEKLGSAGEWAHLPGAKRLQSLFAEIRGECFRFPAVDVSALAEDLAWVAAETEKHER